jgi:hypothetical protein
VQSARASPDGAGRDHRGMARNGTPQAPKSEDALVILLASGASSEEAAEGSGYSKRTVFRRLEDATFRQRVEEARRSFTQRALDRLLSLRLKHVDNLDRLAAADPLPDNPDDRLAAIADLPPHNVRFQASKAVVELGGKLRAESEFDRRLRAVEERLAAMGQGGAK